MLRSRHPRVQCAWVPISLQIRLVFAQVVDLLRYRFDRIDDCRLRSFDMTRLKLRNKPLQRMKYAICRHLEASEPPKCIPTHLQCQLDLSPLTQAKRRYRRIARYRLRNLQIRQDDGFFAFQTIGFDLLEHAFPNVAIFFQ